MTTTVSILDSEKGLPVHVYRHYLLKALLLTALFVFSQSSAAAACKMVKGFGVGGSQTLPQGVPSWDSYLAKKISECGLDKVLPKEYDGCAKDTAGANYLWTELMRGLAFLESSWDTDCHTPNDVGSTPSDGLFQMTHPGDSVKEQKCFTSGSGKGSPFDQQANIDCAVAKMAEIMGAPLSCTVGSTANQLSPAKASGVQTSATAPGGSVSSAPNPLMGSSSSGGGKYWGPLRRKDTGAQMLVDTLKARACGFAKGAVPQQAYIPWNTCIGGGEMGTGSCEPVAPEMTASNPSGDRQISSQGRPGKQAR